MVSPERYNLYLECIRTRIQYHGGVAALLKNTDVINPITTMWKLFHAVNRDLCNTSTDEDQIRLALPIRGFKVYKDKGIEYQDSDIGDMLYRIGQELGIIE